MLMLVGCDHWRCEWVVHAIVVVHGGQGLRAADGGLVEMQLPPLTAVRLVRQPGARELAQRDRRLARSGHPRFGLRLGDGGAAAALLLRAGRATYERFLLPVPAAGGACENI